MPKTWSWPKPPDWAPPLACLCTVMIAVGWLAELRERTHYPHGVDGVIASSVLLGLAFFIKLLAVIVGRLE